MVKKWWIRTYGKPDDFQIIVSLHGSIYSMEYGYDHTFETYVASDLADYMKSYDPKKDMMWLAEIDKKVIGMIAVVRELEGIARLRWFLVHPDFRGQGLGRELMKKALDFCTKCGYNNVFLWTTSDLKSAICLYRRFGFTKIEEKTHEIWGKQVTELRYELQIK
jgi:GNAT superfamily N-acetyltransferase